MANWVHELKFEKFKIMCNECNAQTLNITQDTIDETVTIKCSQCGNEETK